MAITSVTGIASADASLGRKETLKLVIAIQAQVTVSETFIRRHIEELVPGEIGLIVPSNEEAKDFGVPWVELRSGRAQLPYLQRKAVGLLEKLNLGPAGTAGFESERNAVEFLASYGCKTILAEYGPCGCLVADIAVQSGARLFVHFHGYDASRLLRDFAIRKAYSRLFSVATGIIAPSRYIGEKLMAAGCPSSKLHVVPCGVDINEFQPVNSDNDGDGARFIAVGRFVPKKAPQRTISAFAQIAARYPTATLDMVGEGSLLTRCKQQVEQLSLSEKVTFHGALPHKAVRSLLASSDIFVQHSVTDDSGDSEGLPVAILEGMACGLPIVSTRHSGIPEAVLDEVTGLLVPEGDVEAMAAAMSRLLDDPELIKTMGQAGRRRVVENFNSEASLMKLRDVLFGHEQ